MPGLRAVEVQSGGTTVALSAGMKTNVTMITIFCIGAFAAACGEQPADVGVVESYVYSGVACGRDTGDNRPQICNDGTHSYCSKTPSGSCVWTGCNGETSVSNDPDCCCTSAALDDCGGDHGEYWAICLGGGTSAYGGSSYGGSSYGGSSYGGSSSGLTAFSGSSYGGSSYGGSSYSGSTTAAAIGCYCPCDASGTGDPDRVMDNYCTACKTEGSCVSKTCSCRNRNTGGWSNLDCRWVD